MLPFLIDAGAMNPVQGAMTASLAGNAIMSGLVWACSNLKDSAAAWVHYQDARSYSYMLDDKAQVLWKLQSGSMQLLCIWQVTTFCILAPFILYSIVLLIYG